MKKTILIFALFLGLLITSSGFNSTSLNTSIGKPLPDINNEDIDNALAKSQSEGKYVVVNFWSASDGSSRRVVNDYSHWLSQNSEAPVELLSINFDKSERLFNEIVRRDGIARETQHNVSGYQAQEIIRNFHLEDGYGSLLVDPNGEIIAHNPTTSQLAKLVGG